ncbi:MAG: NosD domain-containing protein, partial [Candidatus Hermodarchaeota archaeon]
MKNSNKKKNRVLLLSLFYVSLLIIAVIIQTDNKNNNTISNEHLTINENVQDEYDNKLTKLKTSNYWDLTGTPIVINGSAKGIGANNWTWANEQPWCNGSGTLNNPYVIENVTINGQGIDGVSGISIYSSNEYFIIRNCTFYNSGTSYFSGDSGIKLIKVSHGTIINNDCSNNNIGIYLNESSSNVISGNTASNCSIYGIELIDNSNNNIISENALAENNNAGITTTLCEYNSILKNNVSNNDILGIYIAFGNDNNITENIVSFNGHCGVDLFYSFSNYIYKNYLIENELHARDNYDMGVNFWNTSIIGNYWDNHSTADLDGNGIDDEDYNYIEGMTNSVDYLPIHGDPFHYGEKIHIDGNLNSGNKSWTWASTRAWCNGLGTIDIPYIISDLEINAENDGSCILIGNSSVYFGIENCNLKNSGQTSTEAGIKLDNVNNSILIGNNCSDNYYGISLYLSNDNNLLGNLLQENTYGICLNNSDNNIISENIFMNNNDYALEEDCQGNIFEDNYCIPPLTITNITSTNPDGIYKLGDKIEITVEFTDIVYITGTPQLILNTTENGISVDYTSGSGTDTLSFNYTIELDHYSEDLDYNSSDALILNGGEIEGIVGNDASLILPTPGSLNSLSYNKNIKVDAKTPSVIDVSSTKLDGIYSTGEEINITIIFSELVNVTGTPQISLNASDYDAIAYYIEGNNTDTLIFSYIVGPSHNSLDLDYNSTIALSLNGGNITDSEGLVADLLLPTPGSTHSLSGNKDLIIDTDIPTGTIIINSNAEWTNSTNVILTLTYDDAISGVDKVCYSNDSISWTDWIDPSATYPWTLPSGEGTKTVYFKVRDNAGLISQEYSDTIDLDTTSPTGSITINDDDTWTTSTSVTLSLTYYDVPSGVDKVRYRDDSSSWTDWINPSDIYLWTLSSGEGYRIVYYQVRDNAGSISQYSDDINLDTTDPTGSITIESGADWASSPDVELSLTYYDATSGVDKVCYSNDSISWTGWIDPSATYLWTLPSGDGPKTVYYQIRDNAGHTYSTSDTIDLDTTDPTGSITIESGADYTSSPDVELSLTYYDATSGVDKVCYSN